MAWREEAFALLSTCSEIMEDEQATQGCDTIRKMQRQGVYGPMVCQWWQWEVSWWQLNWREEKQTMMPLTAKLFKPTLQMFLNYWIIFLFKPFRNFSSTFWQRWTMWYEWEKKRRRRKDEEEGRKKKQPSFIISSSRVIIIAEQSFLYLCFSTTK